MYLILAMVLWMAMHGAVEGMVMTRYTDVMAATDAPDDMDGVRCHRWFRWYHWLCRFRYAALISCIMTLCYFTIPPVLAIAGYALIGWECSEVAYNGMRYGKAVIEHENVMGAFVVDGKSVWFIHLARLLEGVALIIGGLL